MNYRSLGAYRWLATFGEIEYHTEGMKKLAVEEGKKVRFEN